MTIPNLEGVVDGQLAGKVALVTGSGRNIGRAVAMRFAGEGADVIVNSRSNGDEAESVAEEVRALGRRAIAVVADVADRDQVRAMTERGLTELGRIDILVNNAGASIRKPSLELSKAEWDTVIAVNQTAVFLCSRAAARHMLKKKSGAIVNLASIMGSSGGGLYPNISYQASKGAVVNMTRPCSPDTRCSDRARRPRNP